MARHSSGRNVHGVLLLDKPIEMSSNAAVQKVKRWFQARKAGHTGSLDVLASGLLPICLGEATKLASFLLESDKRYEVECILGITTTTGDAEGAIVDTRPLIGIERSRIEEVVHSFQGTIQQIPPMYSAIKYQGKPLYQLARQGQVIERQPRWITIYTVNVINWLHDRLRLEVHCSKGTYIRTLVEDIGKALGCGASVSQLRRTQVDNYCEMVGFATVEQWAQEGMEKLDSLLIPLEQVLTQWPQVVVSQDDAGYLRHGQAVATSLSATTGWVRLFAENSTSEGNSPYFIGLGQITPDGYIAPKRLMNR